MSRLAGGPIPGTTGGTFEQATDHFNSSDARTFKQRYFVNSTYAQGQNSPVIFIMCGEGTCDENGFFGGVVKQAKKLHAHMIELEHRYYGLSQPFTDLATENLKYLSVEQALADNAAFQRFAMDQLNLKGKWISVGGSYSGALSAFYRLKHPELVVGALASSAPVKAEANFEEYDYHVSTVVTPECGKAIKAVSDAVENSIASPDAFAKMKALFGLEDVRDPREVLYVVADEAATAVQYGMKDSFCQSIVNSDDVVSAYATTGASVFQRLGITPFQDSFQSAESLNPNDYIETGFGLRGWFYQSCTEFGFFQTAYHDPAVTVRSPKVDLEFHRQLCERLFGIKELPDTDKMNAAYYQPILASTTSNILFTNGSTDPWSMLSLSEKLGNNTNPNLGYFMIQGGSHCSDLSGFPSSSAAQAQDLFSGLAAGWLGSP